MDIKKLYGTVCAVCGEMPLYTFLAHLDRFAQRVINRYGKAYTVIDGEYITPDTLERGFGVDGVYYTAALSFVLGEYKGDEKLILQSEKEAEDAYKSLWRARAKGKHIIKEVW